MAEWDVASVTPVAAPQQADPWAVKTEAKINPEAASHFDKTVGVLKNVGGEAGAIADFFLSTPAFLIGAGAQLTGTVRAMSEGSREPFAQGRAVSHAINEKLGSPVKKVLDMFRSGEAYEQSLTTKGLEKLMSAIDEAGVWAEQKSGGSIPRDAVPMFIETLMAGAPGLGGKAKPFAPAHVTKALREHTEKMRVAAEAEVAAQKRAELTPLEEVVRQPVQQQINSILGIRTPAEQAKITRERRKDLNNIGRERPLSEAEQGQLDLAEARGVREYGTPEEAALYADERTRNEQTYVQGEETRAVASDRASMEKPVGQAEILEVMRKAPEERTNQDLMTLRNARQEGKASPEALALLGAAGIGIGIGANLDDNALRGATLGGLTAAGFVLPHLGRGPSVPSSMRQGGAVKAPGGMWHPEAVERLSKAIIGSEPNPVRAQAIAEAEAAGRPVNAAVRAAQAISLKAWSDSRIKSYLNKYAGTERDPLKAVEIPKGEGTIRWEEAMDASISSAEAGRYKKRVEQPFGASYRGEEPLFPNVPAKELVYQVAGPGEATGKNAVAIRNYLSHAGDFARQNIPPEKLGQYDLVRLIKETNANDIRVAKEMEKAAAESSKDLPVYKEYPDGMKWVELKTPEKLTAEQQKQVRPLTKAEMKENLDMGEELGPHDRGFVALDAQGKPIKNSYTDSWATAETPEKAYLAGKLAQEGNQMGHCVGGYCEGVASGESKIYSLRDKKGLSHVTVEVAERDALNRPGEVELNIEQIKGKQNRAPNKEYLPYVQDFVKEGKWGEVGDLERTGLKDLNKHFEGQAETKLMPIEKAAFEKEFPGQRYVPEADYNRISNEATKAWGAENSRFPRNNERGSIDQQLLMGLGAVGLGGLIGSQLFEEPGTGALLGALTGGVLRLPGAKRRLEQAADAADYGIGNISTRIGNISPALKLRARQFEMRNLSEAYERLHKVVPFMQELAKLPEGQLKNQTERVILTNDKERIAALMKGNRPLVEAWRQVRNVLNDLGEKLQGHGRFREMKDEYFPRLVANVEGLKEALDIPVRTRLEAALDKAEKKAQRERGTGLTNIEQSAIINRELAAVHKSRGNQPGYSKARGVEEITEELRPFYHSPAESLYAYVRGATTDLEMARFFGKDLAQRDGSAGAKYIDLDASIGNIVGRELREKKITAAEAEKLIDMLKSRFGEGERSPAGLVQEMRNLGNMGLLGNIVSAATQAADSLMAVYAQGLRATTTAVAKMVSGKDHISTKDFGLAEHVAEEFTSPSRTSNWLNKMFKYSGFAAIDQFGKNVQLGAAFDRYTRLAETPAGVDKIKRKYEEAYGDELPKLLKDLHEGNMTERVRTLMFSELADMQPISKLELPQGYLDYPNGRLIYMLKTFMVKQMDVVRRDVYNEMKKGNVAEGLKNATAYAAVLGIAGASTDVIKNWLMGRKMSFDGNDIAENILKTFGMNEYVRDKVRQGHPIEAFLGAAVPPYKMMDDIIRGDPKAVQYIPILGKLYYNWELGGREAAELRDAQKAKRQGKEVDVSDRATEFARNKREAAKEKRERAQR